MTQPNNWATVTLFVNILFKLGLVLLLIYSCVIIIRRLQTNRHPHFRKYIKVIETSHLSPHRSIHLIQVGSQIYLIGATDQDVNLISKVDDQTLLENTTETTQQKESNPISIPAFATLFIENLKKRKAPNE